MSEKTKIEWADSTASPWTGCTPASAGCDHCYARTLAARHGWTQGWGEGVPRHRFSGFEKAALAMERKAELGMFRRCTVCGGREFRRWDRSITPGGLSCCTTPGCVALPETETEVARPRVFPSLCDWLDPEVPVEWLADLLDVIRRTPHLDWLLLTKRPGMWRERINAWSNGVAPSNVWIGATCEDQAAAAERIPDLMRIPAAVRFVSAEPMLGPVDLRGLALNGVCLDGLDWVICGGESGPGARPMHPDWPRALRDQCVSAGVPFLFKQWGEWGRSGENGLTLDDASWGSDSPRMGFWRAGAFFAGATTGGEEHMVRVGKERAGRLLDGREWNEIPAPGCSQSESKK